MIRQPRKCAECRQREVVPETLPEYSEEMSHDSRTYHVEIKDFEVLKCRNCGAMVFDDEANDRLADALRAAAEILVPAEIRRHRERLGFTQAQLAERLKISVSTLSRWETGGQIQQRSMDQLLRLAFGLTTVDEMMGRTLITSAQVVAQKTYFYTQHLGMARRRKVAPSSLPRPVTHVLHPEDRILSFPSQTSHVSQTGERPQARLAQ